MPEEPDRVANIHKRRLAVVIDPWQRFAMGAIASFFMGFGLVALMSTENDLAISVIFVTSGVLALFGILGSVPFRFQAGGSGGEFLMDVMTGEDPVRAVNTADAVVEGGRAAGLPADVVSIAVAVSSDSALRYERDVILAFSRAYPNRIPSRGATPGPDLVYRRIGWSVAVEISWALDTRQVATYAVKAKEYGCQALLIVTPDLSRLDSDRAMAAAAQRAPSVRVQIIQWRNATDDEELALALDHLMD